MNMQNTDLDPDAAQEMNPTKRRVASPGFNEPKHPLSDLERVEKALGIFYDAIDAACQRHNDMSLEQMLEGNDPVPEEREFEQSMYIGLRAMKIILDSNKD